jgi:hypothetical protein
MKIVVTDFAEVESREDYDPSAEINPDNFKSLAFEYQFSDWVYCQVKANKEKKNMCGHEHKHGYFGMTKDGRGGLIGGDCGEQYFGALVGWRSEVRRLDNAKALAQRLDDLETLLADSERHESRIAELTQRLDQLYAELKYVVGKLTRPVETRLHHMGKGSSTAVVLRFCRVEYEEDNEGKEKPVYSYYEERIGNVVGANLEGQGIALLNSQDQLKRAKRALLEANADPTRGFAQLGRWIDQISALDDIEKATAKIAQTLNLYTRPDNLKLQIFLTADPRSQRAMAALAIEFAGASWKVADPDELIQQYREQIMAAHKNRTFTVVH